MKSLKKIIYTYKYHCVLRLIIRVDVFYLKVHVHIIREMIPTQEIKQRSFAKNIIRHFNLISRVLNLLS